MNKAIKIGIMVALVATISLVLTRKPNRAKPTGGTISHAGSLPYGILLLDGLWGSSYRPVSAQDSSRST